MVSRSALHIALTALLLCACTKERMGDCFRSTGQRTSVERAVGPFAAIALEDRVDLVLTQDSTRPAQVVVEGGRNLLEAIGTEVDGGVLRITNGLRCNWVRNARERIVVHVRMPLLEHLDYTGVGDISATTTLRARTFRVEQYSGQGSIRLHLDVDTCHASMHTGSGTVFWSGRADVAYLYSAGFSNIDMHDLEAREVHVNNAGTGDFRCAVRDALFVQIAHVGDVYYRGDPFIVEATITGSGQLIRE